jgi:4Fe-4S iron-sulfur cluster binding domain/DR2241 stabilising domain
MAMTVIENPALAAFVAQLGNELALAQVLIRREGAGYELRHVADGGVAAASLRTVKLAEARALAQHTATGTFRPLKAAPTLRTGWRLPAANDAELAEALQHLYPGALADWQAARATNPPVTNYRDYVNRQSGMYRITAKLDDAQAAGVIRAGCGRANCLKRRLWSVAGLEPDAASEKSLIPCLEPCAVLMELARKTVRELQGQEGKVTPCAEPETG